MTRSDRSTKHRARLVFAGAFVLSMLGATRVARAAEHSWNLEYSASFAECPRPDQARSLIVAKLGFDPFVDDAPAQRIVRIVVERDTHGDGRGLLARVSRTTDPHTIAERTVKDPSGNCRELVTAAAFTASLLVDPTGAARKRHEERTEPPPSDAVSPAEDPFAPERSAPEPSSPVNDSSRGAGAAIAARVLGSVGVAPAPSFGFSVGAGLAGRQWAVWLEGRADLPAGSELADGRGARASVILGSVVPCYALGVIRACLVASAGAMLAESTNVTPIERDVGFLASVGARAGVELPVRAGVAVAIGLEGAIPLRRLTIRMQGTEIWTAPPLAGSLGAGLVLRFL